MMPLSRITGRVEDGTGKGIPGARVELRGGGLGLNSRTDADGRFGLYEFLLPGEYTLSVAPPLGLKLPDPEPDRILGWTRTWYPGVALAEAAEKILLRPGAEVRDMKLKLLAVPAHSVRGMLLDAVGKPVPNIEITLGETARGNQALASESRADGSFEFPAVVDGEWLLHAEGESGDLEVRASQWVEMMGRDLEGQNLHLSGPFSVRGNVVCEKPESKPCPKLPAIFLSPHAPRSQSAFVTLGPRAQPDTDGGFRIEEVYPGRYGIYQEADPPAPSYLDMIRMGEAVVATDEVEISSGVMPMTLVYKSNGGTVSGAVEKCAAGRVVLIPKDRAMQRAGFLRAAACDSTDRYFFAAVRPGRYYALAVQKDATLNFRKLDESLFKEAATIIVNAGETSSADLHFLIRSPR